MNYFEDSINEYNEKDAQEKVELAISYILNDYENLDFKKTLILLKKSALQGNSGAQYLLGLLYQGGIEALEMCFEVDIFTNENIDIIDLDKSLYWFEKSAKQGNPKSQCNLGYIYENGIGVKIDYKKAINYYKQAAVQGDEIGQCNLGYMYEKGLGVDIDYKKAFKFYKRSATQGDEVGQNNLGEMYRDGLGTQVDYDIAMQLFQESAVNGCIEAFYNIGCMYEKGLGVDTDYEKAINIYEKASNLGHEKAKKKLERLLQLNK
ncbi:tetratricopeptide repeat protein [Paraclostridium sordellii]|uniref:tetratricopeptide repeat protein n=1 Tax=Paraclostridium sordellii TaxID=1505 RepID=UPI0005425926|nr:tetratricopeptide repeat protein [Paeniclostridium sordellii]MCH1966516.1 sel1 repeat family protein [Paeniclostridium sordellii]CEK33554.1 Sel1 repeat family,hypothetical protein,3-carboxymuconate cyclase,Sel1 repeat [[Clostridium] sordellii] [Paeniclostridium sordellii]